MRVLESFVCSVFLCFNKELFSLFPVCRSFLPTHGGKSSISPQGRSGTGSRCRNKVPPTGRTRFLFQDIKVSLFVFYFIVFITISFSGGIYFCFCCRGRGFYNAANSCVTSRNSLTSRPSQAAAVQGKKLCQ